MQTHVCKTFPTEAVARSQVFFLCAESMGYQDLGVQDKIRPRGYTNSLYNITQSSDSEDLRLNYKIMLRGCANRLYNIPNSSDSDAEETHEQSLQHPQQQ